MNLKIADMKAVASDLYDRYNAVLDDGLLEKWPHYFIEDAVYRVTTRENWEGRYPLSTMICEGVGMMRDRVAAIENSMMYAPRVYRRFLSGLQITAHSDFEIETRTNFLVVQTLPDKPSETAFCGTSFDCVRLDGDEARFSRRVCVLDTEMIPNSLIYPI